MTAWLPEGAAHDSRAPWNDDELEGDDLDPDYAYETARDEAPE